MYVIIYSPNNDKEIDYYVTSKDCSFRDLEEFIEDLAAQNPKIDIKHILRTDQEYKTKERRTPKVFDISYK